MREPRAGHPYREADAYMQSFEKPSNRDRKRENLPQRAYLNSLTNILEYGAKTVTSFLITPFLVHGLGRMLFGVWQVLWQFSQYIGWCDIRVTQVLKWAIARDRRVVPEAELREYVTASLLLMLVALPLLALAGAVIAWYAPVLTGVDAAYVGVVRIAASLAVLSLILSKLFGILDSILRGMNLDFKRLGLFAVLIMAGGGLKVLAVHMGYGLIGLATVQLLIALLTGMLLFWLVRVNVPWLGLARIRFGKSKTFLQASGWFMGWTFVSLLLTSSDRMLLGYFAGPMLVTQYVITHYLASSIHGLIDKLTMGAKPGISTIYGEGRYEQFFTLRRYVMLITMGLAGVMGAVVLALNRSFTLKWIGESSFAGQPVNLLIVIVFIQYLLISNDSTFITMTLDLKRKVITGFAAAILSIVFSALLIGRLGIAGLCIGMIAGRMVMSIGFPLILLAKTGKTPAMRDFNYRIVIVMAMLLAAGYHAGTVILIDNWFLLLAAAGGLFLLAGLVTFFGGLSASERGGVRAYATKIRILGRDS